ncbi:MAG: carboxypeptidase-like regulatory domain-containing protein [Ferruginibacter sp.]
MKNRAYLFFFPVLLLSFFINITVVAQINISGKVIDENSGQPLTGVSVYFNNTSIGTSTNADGSFSFTGLKVPNTELIVSSIGYEILAYRISATEDNGKHFLFKLTLKKEQLKEVLVLTDAARKKWLASFKDNFLGITEEAASSKILNETSIYFTSGVSKNSFNAYADTAIIIRNEMLGYLIYFQLVEFGYNGLDKRTYFYGYTRYIEMGNKKKWIRNRRNCYYGSTLHFYRSLIANKLQEEGYYISLLKSVKTDTVLLKSHTAPKYQLVPISGNILARRDSSNEDNYIMSSDDDVMVQYIKQPASKNYLLKKIMVQGNLKNGFTANMHFIKIPVGIDSYGIISDPLAVEYNGYWTYEKAANMLPYNYTPD